jgi:hypothetical protein
MRTRFWTAGIVGLLLAIMAYGCGISTSHPLFLFVTWLAFGVAIVVTLDPAPRAWLRNAVANVLLWPSLSGLVSYGLWQLYTDYIGVPEAMIVIVILVPFAAVAGFVVGATRGVLAFAARRR